MSVLLVWKDAVPLNPKCGQKEIRNFVIFRQLYRRESNWRTGVNDIRLLLFVCMAAEITVTYSVLWWFFVGFVLFCNFPFLLNIASFWLWFWIAWLFRESHLLLIIQHLFLYSLALVLWTLHGSVFLRVAFFFVASSSLATSLWKNTEGLLTWVQMFPCFPVALQFGWALKYSERLRRSLTLVCRTSVSQVMSFVSWVVSRTVLEKTRR